jgi:uncharacterized protein (DUF433 family)
MTATSALLGKGLYTPKEAARYARLSSRTLTRWMFGDDRGEAVFTPQFPDSEERIITFLDFVQLLAIRDIRSKHKVPLAKLRQAIEAARNNGIAFPFAVQHKTFLFGDLADEGHGEVVIEVAGKLQQASGKARGNLVMREVAELYLRDLYFDPKTELAAKFFPFGEALDRGVVMDPRTRFGEPVAVACRYPTEVLLESYKVEGGVTAAAAALGVRPEDIEIALRYYDLLGVTAA